MRNKVLYIIIGLTALYFLLSYFTNLRTYRGQPANELGRRLTEINLELDNFRNNPLREGPAAEMRKREQTQLIIERGKVLTEMTLRHYYLDQLLVILSIMSLFLLVGGRLRRKQQQLPTDTQQVIRDLQVNVEAPCEEYVDPYDFERRTMEGFRTKDEATQYIKQDPLLKCDYCKGQLRSTFTGQRESVQLVTFYKAVPEGAKDLRVVLGSYWFPKHATELRCSQCGRTVKR